MSDSSFGFERPEDSPGFLLWQTTTLWQRLIKKALAPYDVSHAQFVIMALLLWLEENKAPTTQTKIANLSKLDKMTVSKSITALVMRGMIHRVAHETDTRAKSVSLTSGGKTLVRELVQKVEQADSDFFGALTSQEKGTLIRILEILNQRY